MDIKRELLIKWYEDAYDRYGEGVQEVASDYWYNEFKDSDWKGFHELDSKLKVKFYYEDEENEQ